MKPNNISFPFYMKAAFVMLLLSLLALFVYTTNSIIFPVYYGLLLALALQPMVTWLMRKKIPNVAAILIALFLAIIIITVILYLLLSQISSFTHEWPQLKHNLSVYADKCSQWIMKTFHVKKQAINDQVEKVTNNTLGDGGSIVTTTLSSLTGIINITLIIPVYTFLILYYRRLLMKFLLDVFNTEHSPRIIRIIEASKAVVSSYIIGLLLEMAAVTILNVLGFWIIGCRYVFLLALMAAVLNLIPYIGMIIAGIISVFITMSYTQDISIAIGILAVLIIVQTIDNNLIFPKVVGGKVKVNAFFSIVAVFFGGALGGISGMFLTIPTLAIMKVAFDDIPSLTPYGMVLGDDIPVKYLSLKHFSGMWGNHKKVKPTEAEQ